MTAKGTKPKPKKKSAKPRVPVTDELFVRTWMRHETQKAMAADLGVSEFMVFNRASKLRRAGVNLPKKERKPTDVKALNELIASLSVGGTPNG